MLHIDATYGNTRDSSTGYSSFSCLRNFNQSFVEERNRVQIDSMSDYLLAPTKLAELFLKYENINDQVYVTGNLIESFTRL